MMLHSHTQCPKYGVFPKRNCVGSKRVCTGCEGHSSGVPNNRTDLTPLLAKAPVPHLSAWVLLTGEPPRLMHRSANSTHNQVFASHSRQRP